MFADCDVEVAILHTLDSQLVINKMPRELDIGWQHGKMIGGHRHHIQCNYCHRTMIGGVTRFKKHLASKRGEIKGCEAVPKEIRDNMRKHLALGKMKKSSEKKEKRLGIETLNALQYDSKDSESDESDREIAAARLESLRTLHKDEENRRLIINEPKPDHQQFVAGTQECYHAFSSVPSKDEQGLVPPKATDPGWAHGTMVEGDRQKIKCRYCHKVILGGGISRLKQHLAGERGNIAPCEKVPEDVRGHMQQHLGFKVLERLKKRKELETGNGLSQEGMEVGCHDDLKRSPNATSALSNGRRRRRKSEDGGSSGQRKRTRNLLTAPATPVSQPSLHLTFASQESMDQADMAVAKFMYDAGIPFGAAKSLYFQPMADAIAAVGPGYKMPSYHALRGKLLDKSVREAGELYQELRKSWEVTGCSVMADRWIDKSDRTVINFFVYCPKGTTFLKSVDASDISKNPEALMNLFDSIVQVVGPKNIVHFLTDGSASFQSAGKLLLNKYKTFFWSTCAAHCIDLMLEEFGKLGEVKEILAKAKRISRFIYNHAWVLDLMRKRTGGRDIVRPAMTKSATDFLTLQSIVSLKEPLHQMFTSTTWVQSDFSKQRSGIKVTEVVLDPLFWSSCAKILKVGKPVITVLHFADSEERPSMGYIYDAMEKAKKGIIVAFNNKEIDYLPYLEVIDHIWEKQLHSPLHAAAYYLNPSIFYNPSFSNSNKRIQKGLLDCIETLEPDLAVQERITSYLSYYEQAVGDFSRPVAVRGRDSLSPATWWSLYASDCPDLQRFAIRILSQTCSRTRCERNHSIADHVHSNKRNRLEDERLKDLIFIHHNLRLQQRQTVPLGNKALMRGGYDPICLEGMNSNARDWVEDPGVLLGEDISWMDVALPSDSIAASNMVSNVDDNSIDDRSSDGTDEEDGAEDS
ncbi:uncharacterized protein LOC131233916 isoform X2 [Magnolia sinica]|uniref:uncharacterized protein LOC131233916 isoform X2 n=1 Tax=Magnolia sinica TaxID=86752 RepID=UPI00265A7FA0|nr:uncharacterized protein LOC131233916 isoform X2 [Magnolia sinica]